MNSGQIVRHSLRYFLVLVSLIACVTFLGYLVPDFSSSFIPFAIAFIASAFVLETFAKDNLRIPRRSEYWILVGLSTAIKMVVEIVALLVVISLSPPPEILMTLIFVVLGTLVSSVLLHMFAYSRFFANGALHRQERHRLKQIAGQ